MEATGERLPIREQLVEQRTDGEDVAAVVDLLPHDLLGRHVVQCADEHARLGHARGLGDAGDAKIENLQGASGVDHRVGRLDVTMDDPRLVREGQTIAQLFDELQLSKHGHQRPGRDNLGQRLPLDVLHRDERLAPVFADIEDEDDVRMAQARRRSRLSGESLAELLVVPQQQLDRDVSIEPRIPRAVQDAHTALPDATEDFVSADDRGVAAHQALKRALLACAANVPVSRLDIRQCQHPQRPCCVGFGDDCETGVKHTEATKITSSGMGASAYYNGDA